MSPRKIAIIDGHPDPDPSRFVHALAASYGQGAASAGHMIRNIDVARLAFPLIAKRGDWEAGPLTADIAAAQETIWWAEHLFIVYPLWLGDMPALLKGFFEQVIRPRFAFGPRAQGLPEKRLNGRSAHVAVTTGMPAYFYRLYFGAHSVKSLERNILRFVGIKPVERSLIGNIEGDADERARWLRAMRASGSMAR